VIRAMPQHLHLDFETFSQIDLRDVGAYRYAFDPSTEILCAAMALDDGEPVAWSSLDQMGAAALEPMWDALENPDVLIYAHNAQFEMAICQALMWKTWGIPCPDISRFRCTLSLARRAALPGSLDKLAVALALAHQKDKKGASLICKFSVIQSAKKPTKKNPQGLPPHRIRPEDDPVAFAEFVEYCRQDVRAEQEVAHRLAYFDDELNNANYSLDARINARGVPVNIPALQHAQKLIDEETTLASARFRELTGFEVTQGKVFLEWLQRLDYPLENLQAETIETFLEGYEGAPDVPDGVLALRLKQSTAYAAIKKVQSMIDCAGPHDNRIRGTLNHHGATTGRWTASLVQFQNMKRATINSEGVAWSERAYADLRQGVSREMLEVCYGPPLEVISSCIRHFVQDSKACSECEGLGGNPGDVCCACCGSGVRENNFFDADYSAIEARIVCWLAGQEDALEEYRAGVDRYKRMASLIYGVRIDEVNKHPQRFVGKQAVLGCGFGMGAPKFRDTCKRMGGYDLPLGLEETAIKAFRAAHKKIVAYWYDVERAAKKAIVSQGGLVQVRNVVFLCREIEGMPFLLLRLPSGRKLAYPRPMVTDDRITFYGRIAMSQLWGRVDTYGGKLVENITQAVAADIMANGAHNAENAGYEIATLIHDQALAYVKPGQSAEEFTRLLTQLPPWAEGLPVEAEGGVVPFYRKD